jgi:hypothetical protein
MRLKKRHARKLAGSEYLLPSFFLLLVYSCLKFQFDRIAGFFKIHRTATSVSTFIGGPAKQGEEPVLNEPTGLTVAGDTMYVADTNAHRIRAVDLKTKAVKTLELKDVLPVE